MDDKLREYLVALAANTMTSEDESFNPSDYHHCVAHSLGWEDGEIELARLLLAKFGGPGIG